MKEIEFDLLTEPWIRVRLKDNTVQEVSLTDTPWTSSPPSSTAPA